MTEETPTPIALPEGNEEGLEGEESDNYEIEDKVVASQDGSPQATERVTLRISSAEITLESAYIRVDSLVDIALLLLNSERLNHKKVRDYIG